ncbi:hypothetical protein CAPTEDRAFT_220525 [Capitella teleta]|uniref:Uncharacterized protein n=1 Tax=Capitella teleta TaxID=283909 RepID=R7TMT5_CAPTE|nr:hypothetical protein CAPTEDRAFT_220525 [Capitella teleta]|eukprot:ELT92861.1 hypothetical protein CAPTEDRAFT_220525 [Capitella teleta]
MECQECNGDYTMKTFADQVPAITTPNVATPCFHPGDAASTNNPAIMKPVPKLTIRLDSFNLGSSSSQSLDSTVAAENGPPLSNPVIEKVKGRILSRQDSCPANLSAMGVGAQDGTTQTLLKVPNALPKAKSSENLTNIKAFLSSPASGFSSQASSRTASPVPQETPSPVSPPKQSRLVAPPSDKPRYLSNILSSRKGFDDVKTLDDGGSSSSKGYFKQRTAPLSPALRPVKVRNRDVNSDKKEERKVVIEGVLVLWFLETFEKALRRGRANISRQSPSNHCREWKMNEQEYDIRLTRIDMGSPSCIKGYHSISKDVVLSLGSECLKPDTDLNYHRLASSHIFVSQPEYGSDTRSK